VRHLAQGLFHALVDVAAVVATGPAPVHASDLDIVRVRELVRQVLGVAAVARLDGLFVRAPNDVANPVVGRTRRRYAPRDLGRRGWPAELGNDRCDRDLLLGAQVGALHARQHARGHPEWPADDLAIGALTELEAGLGPVVAAAIARAPEGGGDLPGERRVG